MEIIKIAGVALITCIATMLVKQIKPEISIFVSICGGIVILFLCVNFLTEILGIFNFVVEKTGLNTKLFNLIIKIIGVGYITEFSANICNDSGQSSLSDKILLAGKIIIFSMSIPIIKTIIEIIAGLLP